MRYKKKMNHKKPSIQGRFFPYMFFIVSVSWLNLPIKNHAQ
ncbi:hypothetical protein KP78_31050 [Jeotgalibacillus soli]|uniref:Uncharacterized protein n=1 Tax=Jeotgalibacillus soli TaxID=889306 RepID=A0A0C2VI10_9BACL|nr:hypothetical protein KP78_31050 [Jeotgalibacillus soli]